MLHLISRRTKNWCSFGDINLLSFFSFLINSLYCSCVCSRFWKSIDDIESNKLEREIRDSITRIIREREKVIKEEGNFGTDLLGLLVEAYNDKDEKNRLTLEEVVDNCKTFYIAGHETTTSLLSWTILLLAIDTDWQDKVRKEVLELFGDQNPNAEGIARMKQVHSMTLYPMYNLVQVLCMGLQKKKSFVLLVPYRCTIYYQMGKYH